MIEEYDYLHPLGVPIDEHSDFSQPIVEDCSSGIVPEDSTVLGTVTEDGKRTILVSEVTTIHDKFFKMNKAMMTRYLNTRIRDGSLSLLLGFSFTTQRITWQCRDYKHVNFFKLSRSSFIADVEVHLKLTTKQGPREWAGMMTLFGSVENDCLCTIEDFIPLSEYEERDLTALSPFLIPIYKNRQMDQEMEMLLKRYHPEALSDPSKRDACELARRMGLKIIRLPVYNHRNAPTILFFVQDTILVKESNSNSTEPPQEVEIPANTIVINTNHRWKDYSDYYIYHECVHYEEHYMFFKLQEMHTNDIQRMKTKIRVVEAGEKITSPLYWMEVQANRGAYGLMLPLTDTEARIRAETSLVTQFRHPGDVYEIAGKKLSSKLDLPYFRIRARMIQLGHIYAKGALNKVDGAYIEPFSFDLESWQADEQTYVIDEKTVKAIYDKSRDFRTFMDSGKFVYCDGHVVRNTPEFIEDNDGFRRLTPEANRHVNRCCIRFVRRYEQRNLEKYVYGRMYYDADYVAQTNFYIYEELAAFNHDEVKARQAYTRNFPRDFRAAFHKLRDRNNMSMDDMADFFGTSRRTLERWLANPGQNISADFITKLTLLWKLPDWLSDLMLDRAFIRLSDCDDRNSYIQQILHVYWSEGEEKANEYLIDHEQAPLAI